jgi:diguanylate cyclase (GGDEF)-like protein/PAS domain S-box-containing protein
MPDRRAVPAARPTTVLPSPRQDPGWRPRAAGVLSHSQPLDVLQAGLLTWADQDDGCLALLEGRIDQDPQVSWVNRRGAQLFGYAPEELLGQPLERLLRSPFAAAEPRRREEPLVDSRRVVRRSLRVQRRDGSPLRMALTTVPLQDGEAQRWILRLVPEPDVERVAEDLRTSHERFRALADRAPIAIFSSESGLRLAYVNNSFADLYGERAEQLAGMGWLGQVHVDDRPAVVAAMTRVLEGQPQELPLRVVRTDGQERAVLARIVPVPDSRRDAGFVGTFEDVTERQAWEASLAHQASHDPLTGLLNRRRLLELLTEELRSRAAPGAGQPALLFLDLDDFKVVNDSLGHHAGDQLLLHVAHRLRGAVRDVDVVSRFGGDEFAVLCRGVADEQAAVEVARRLLEAVTGPVQLGSTTVAVSGSIGVVIGGQAHAEAEDVLRDADVAMYQAKAAGKDCWAVFDEQAREQAQRRVDLARDLRHALDRGDLDVHYQPVVRVPSLPGAAVELVSVEALARWSHATWGQVPPADFVALAEENGLVGQLGLQVLREACAQMVRWTRELGPSAPATVSVNVSTLQMRQPDFPEVVAAVLAETGLAGPALCLELTETVVMHDTSAAALAFHRLHELGVRVSIDDFGTGHSSLSVLRRLPFDQLKIDRSLLTDLCAGTHDPVVAAVVAMGLALQLDIVAEGVETTEQVAELRRLGCPLAQGFLFSEPLAPAALGSWTRALASPGSRT